MSRTRLLLVSWGLASVALLAAPRLARAGEDDSVAPLTSAVEPGEYHTPLAGKPLDETFLGRHIVVDERDRGQTVAVSLGGIVFVPRVGSEWIAPFGAFYVNQIRLGDERHLRAELSIVENKVEASQGLAPLGLALPPGLEVAGHFENETVPVGSTETFSGVESEGTSIYRGALSGGPGIGWRRPIFPFEVDSDVRVTAYYDAGFLYTRRDQDTSRELRLPPNTLVHGPHLRIRLDALRRNILELPHEGGALGLDFVFQRRDRWSEHGWPGFFWFEKGDTRDASTLAAYGVAAGGLPFFSEKHRWVVQVHAGTSPSGRLDRFSAFRIGGGPPTTEAGDLARVCYPGAAFDELLARDYFVGSVEYRYEALFFLYLHARVTLLAARAATVDDGRVRFERVSGQSLSGAASSGFLWSSTIYLEYSLDLGAARGGTRGSSVLLSWSKSF